MSKKNVNTEPKKIYSVTDFIKAVIINTRDTTRGRGIFIQSAADWLSEGVEDGVIAGYTPDSLEKETATATYVSSKTDKPVTKTYTGASAVIQKLITAGSFDANYGNTNGKGYAIIYLPGEGKKRNLGNVKKWY